MGNYFSIVRYLSYRDVLDFALFRARLLAASRLGSGQLKHHAQVVDLTFYDGTFKYVVRFPRKRGPCPFNSVYTRGSSGLSDVTSRVKEFAGPCHNFYGIPTTPNMLGFANLCFCLIGDNGEDIQLEFSADSEIVLTKNTGQKMVASINESGSDVTIDSSCCANNGGGSKVVPPEPATVRTDLETDRSC